MTSDLRIGDDVEIICECGAKIGHHRTEFSWIALLRKASSIQPTKAIIVFSDILLNSLLNSLGLAEHQIGNIKHEMNKMTADQMMKQLVFSVDLCGRETKVLLFFMTGSRCDADNETVKLEHHPEKCLLHCQKSVALKLTRALDERRKAGKLNFSFVQVLHQRLNNEKDKPASNPNSCCLF